MGMERHYLRCPACLGVWAVDCEVETPDPQLYGHWAHKVRVNVAQSIFPFVDAGCPYHCGTNEKPEHMGRVCGNELVRIDGAVPECDGSCVHARGPICVCKCCGMNHGAGLLAYVAVESTHGKPEARFKSAPKTLADAKRRATEWSAAKTELEGWRTRLIELRDELYRRKQNGEFLPEVWFRKYVDANRWIGAVHELDELRTHKGRMKKLNEFVQKATQITQHD